MIVGMGVVASSRSPNSEPVYFILSAPSSAPSHDLALSPEAKILRSFYYSTSGDEWLDNTNWLNLTVSWCSWYGITCNENEAITDIILWRNKLGGSIPSSIYQLSSLKHLELRSNQLSSSISSEIGLLSALEWLDLYDNKLTSFILLKSGCYLIWRHLLVRITN